jgi:hypothetical protein
MRFDGLYIAPGEGYTAYLRFYPDGEVISCSSTGTPEEVSRWFARGRQPPTACTRNGDKVSFEFWIDFSDRGEPAPKGAIRYSGDLTGSDTEETYRFVDIALA